MVFKHLTDNAKNLAANAKIEDMSRLIKNHMAGKPDAKNVLSGVMDISKEVRPNVSVPKYSNEEPPRYKVPNLFHRSRRIYHQSNAPFWKSPWTPSNSTSTPVAMD